VLENVIKFRWRSLPQEQREGIRSYLVQTIIKVRAARVVDHIELQSRGALLTPHPPPHPQLCSDEAVMRAEAPLVGKMNAALVGVLRHDWPAQWPSFIPDIVAASK